MTDVLLDGESKARIERSGNRQTSADEPEHILGLIELFFFAYRDFTGDADALLQSDGFGRAHHRVLHFVHRQPGLRVADLLDILKITKQSLGRVLRQLVERGFVEQKTGARDRRERRLFVTAKGADLARRLAALQQERVATALASLPPEGVETVRTFLLAMVDPDDRKTVAELTGKAESER